VYVKSQDLMLVSGVAVVGMALAILGLINPVTGLLVGLPLVLIVPGYALMSTFAGPSLGVVERLVMTIGFSLTLTILGGLALNLTPWGLQAVSWAVFLGGATLVFAFAAQWRRLRQTELGPVSLNPGLQPREIGLFGLAVAVVVAAILLARWGVQEQNANFTQLSLTPAKNSAGSVQLQIVSTEQTSLKYRLQLLNGSQVVKEWPSIELAPEQTWQETVPVTPTNGNKLQALLYRLDDPNTVYRRVDLSGQ
jgi:uncharacterized membrane protein